MTFPSILGFQNPEALLLLLILPVWWVWRRKRSEDAIVFSRTNVLARGPKAGQTIARLIFILRNVAIASVVVALARPRS